MPAKDKYHDSVRKALIKEGWIITHDPLRLDYGGFDFFIDLGAETVIGATKDGRKIAVEIKSFLGTSSLSDFHLAVGQFVNYRLVLKRKEPERMLYIAISQEIYESFFMTVFGQIAREEHQLKLLIFDTEGEVIRQWLE